MKYDPKKITIEQDKRREKAFERLGTRTPRCLHCQESRGNALEAHHIAGQKFDDETMIVCRNCHRCLSDDQKDHPKPQTEPVHVLEGIGHYLLGLADFLAMIIERFREFGHRLIELAVECQQAGIGGAK